MDEGLIGRLMNDERQLFGQIMTQKMRKEARIVERGGGARWKMSTQDREIGRAHV